MLYTRKGDNGTTGLFSAKGRPASGWGCNQRISKSSAIAEALGNLDEINSFLGVLKVKCGKEKKLILNKQKFSEILHRIQEDLFIIQAELAGADKKISKEKILKLEEIINLAEKKLPVIKTFFISGGTEISALFDFARTMARRAERRVVEVSEEGKVKISKESLAFLNRLSGLLYILARLSNHKFDINEISPKYK